MGIITDMPQIQTWHTAPNEGKKSRRPRDREKEAGGKKRNFKIRNMSRQQSVCTEAERHTDRDRHRQTDRHRDTERRGRLTAKRREEMKAVFRMKGRETRKKCQEKAPRTGKVRGRRQ